MHKCRMMFFVFYLGMFCSMLPVLTKADPGESGWTILEKLQSAQFRGISALSPLDNNLLGHLYNPALLSTLNKYSFVFHSELGFFEDVLGGATYTIPGPSISWAAGLVYYDMGQIELSWIENNQVLSETVTAGRDILGMVSGSVRFNNSFCAGVALKVGRSELVERSTATVFATDLGVLLLPNADWSISLAARNLGFSTSFLEAEIPLPASLYFGTGYVFKASNLHILPGAGLAYNLVEGTVLPEVGLELSYDILSLTAGYRFNIEETNLHLGIGINWQNINLNYAYIPGVYLNASHRITLGLSFGSVLQPVSEAKTISKTITANRKVLPKKSGLSEKNKPRVHVLPKVRQLKIKKNKQRLNITWKKPLVREHYKYNVYLKSGKGRYYRINKFPIKRHFFNTKILKRKRTYYVIVKTVAPDGKESTGHNPDKFRLY